MPARYFPRLPRRAASRRPTLGCLLATLLGAVVSPSEAHVVPRHVARLAGLERVWTNQAALDPSTQTVAGAALHGGTLYLLTSSGTLQAFDAESGATRWSERLASESTVVAGPSVRTYDETDDSGAPVKVVRCAATVGSRVFVLTETARGVTTERAVVTERAPGGAPVLADTHVYVPSVNGGMVGYPLTDADAAVRLAGSGAATGEAALAGDRLLWTSVRGELNVAPVGKGGVPYRFDAAARLVGAPATAEGVAYVVTDRGVVVALDVASARARWRVSLGEPVARPVAVVGGVAYVASTTPTLHAFDAGTGERKWSVEGLSAVASASDRRVFAVSPDGSIGVLDIETGRPVASLPGGGAQRAIFNPETDRMYLISATGYCQCLREEGRPLPYRHGGEPTPPPGEPPAADAPAAEETPATVTDEPTDESAEEPTDGGDAPADAIDPFAPDEGEPPAADEPADAAPANEDDPFADF